MTDHIHTSDIPMVSFVMPVFDPPTRNFVASLRSITEQTSPDWELILVDDGSRDPDVIAQIDALADTDMRVHAFWQENQGPSAARNLGTSHARGRYVMYVDADDELTPTVIEDILEASRATDPDLILGMLQFINSDSEKLAGPDRGIRPLSAEECKRFYVSTLAGRMDPLFKPTSHMLVKNGPIVRALKTTIAQQTPFAEDLVVSEDTVWNLDMLARTESISLVSRIWYWYWVAHESTSRGYRPNAPEETAAVLRAVTERARAHGAEYPSAVLSRILGEVNRAVRTHYVKAECPLSFREKTIGVNRLLNAPHVRRYARFEVARQAGIRILIKYMLSKSGLLLPYWTVQESVERMRGSSESRAM